MDGIEHPTLKAAYSARYLLNGDQHWADALAVACVSDTLLAKFDGHLIDFLWIIGC